MIEEDALSLHLISYVFETSYYRVEIYRQDSRLWKSYTFLEKEYIDVVMPYIFSWNIHVCIHCNRLQLLFPYKQGISLFELCKKIKTLDESTTHLQHLLLTLQQAQLKDNVSRMLCDQRNLVLYGEDWNLYGNPRLEILLRKSCIDERCWQKLCADVCVDIKKRHYAHLPTPQIYETTIEKLQGTEKLEIHQLLSLLGQLKGCYQGILPKPKRYQRFFHYIMILILVLMVLMSILFFAYEYQKAHQEYFNNIEQIGDVMVNPDE